MIRILIAIAHRIQPFWRSTSTAPPKRLRPNAYGYSYRLGLLGLGLMAQWPWAGLVPTASLGRSPQPTPLLAARPTHRPLPIPAPAALQPAVPSFNSQRLNQQIQLYSQYLASYGPPDVLIVGSSRSLQGIDPLALQAALTTQGYGPIRVYNFGVNGATAQVVDFIVRRVLTPEQLPRLILWGDGSRAFNSGRPDLTYTSILASAGYRWLNAGHRAIPPAPLVAPAQGDPALWPDCMDSFHWWRAEGFAPPTDWLTRNPRCLGERSRSYSPTEPNPATLPRLVPELEPNGFQAVATEFDPSTYYQQYPFVPGNYDASYVPFLLEGEQMQATETLARYLRSQRIPLVFVNLPLTQAYLDPVRLEYEQQFRHFIQQLAAREGFLVQDLLGEWADQPSYFADPSHLNQQGARAVGQRLSDDTGIPWNRFLYPSED